MAYRKKKEEAVDSYRHEAEPREIAVPVGLASCDISKPKSEIYDYDPHLNGVKKQLRTATVISRKVE